MGWTLNEYALGHVERRATSSPGKTEEEIYAKLGLDYIPPELRENTGEIEAAETTQTPQLVELATSAATCRCTRPRDGKNSIEEMGEAARELGYEYIAITDHSKAVTVANGMDEKRTLEQIKKIRAAPRARPRHPPARRHRSRHPQEWHARSDDEILAQLDVVVAPSIPI